MPESESSEYATSIPLRDNGIPPGLRASAGPLPNPYTRLEAVHVVWDRLEHLVIVVKHMSPDPDAAGLVMVLNQLADHLRVAIFADLEELESVRASQNPLRMWVDAARDVLYPQPPR